MGEKLSFINNIADIHVAARNYRSVQCLHIRKCNYFNILTYKHANCINKGVKLKSH